MTVDLQRRAQENKPGLQMALELSNAKWRLALRDGSHQRQVAVRVGNVAVLGEQLAKPMAERDLAAETAMVSRQ